MRRVVFALTLALFAGPALADFVVDYSTPEATQRTVATMKADMPAEVQDVFARSALMLGMFELTGKADLVDGAFVMRERGLTEVDLEAAVNRAVTGLRASEVIIRAEGLR